MKKYKLIFSSLMILLSGAALSQDNYLSDDGYFSNRGKDNWFISMGGGVNLYAGTEDLELLSVHNLAPSADFSFGHFVLPSLGFRLQLHGVQGYGKSSLSSPYSAEILSVGVNREIFYYAGGHFDLLWNVLDMGNNYKNSRIFKLIPFVGAGAVSSFKGDLKPVFCVSVSAGFIFNFRASELISFNLELRSTANDGRLDKVNTLPLTEVMCSATAGVQFEINSRKYIRRYEMQSSYKYELDMLRKALKKQEKAIIEKDVKIDELNQRYLKLLKEEKSK
jgi:hypothetical protein